MNSKKIITISILSFSTLFLLTLVLTIIGLSFVSRKTNTAITHFPQVILKSIRQPSLKPNFNFIVLGVDPRNDLLEKTTVSDSILLGRLTDHNQVNLISIPRDLWVYSLSTKVNQIYPLSLEKVKSTESRKFIKEQFGLLTGQNIDRTIIVTTENLIELTKIIGGVDLELTSTYTDTQYPNPDYIQNPSPKTPIYKTISFPKGKIHLDESNITEFVRSRKGQYEDGSGGSDTGRIERQQLLITAIISKLKSPEFYKNTNNLFQLYRLWNQKINTDITDQDILSLAISNPNLITNITLNRTSIPVGDSSKTDILYHPSRFISPAWVYIPRTQDYHQFKEYISNFLKQ